MRKPMTMGDFLPPSTAAAAAAATWPSNNAIQSQPQPQPTSTRTTPYRLRATKKGGAPCAVESRKHHKVVVVSNIEGDGAALLTALQKALGTGGVLRRQEGGSSSTTIEVQGEHHLEKIKRFCLTSGCVVGATKQSKAEAVEAAAGKSRSNPNNSNRNINSNINSSNNDTTSAIIDGSMPLSQKAIKAMKPAALKEHLAARQLSTQGNKKELLARLVEASRPSCPNPEKWQG